MTMGSLLFDDNEFPVTIDVENVMAENINYNNENPFIFMSQITY
jgi:hypothetical protein